MPSGWSTRSPPSSPSQSRAASTWPSTMATTPTSSPTGPPTSSTERGSSATRSSTRTTGSEPTLGRRRRAARPGKEALSLLRDPSPRRRRSGPIQGEAGHRRPGRAWPRRVRRAIERNADATVPPHERPSGGSDHPTVLDAVPTLILKESRCPAWTPCFDRADLGPLSQRRPGHPGRRRAARDTVRGGRRRRRRPGALPLR